MATMLRVIREFLKIPETTFTTQEILDVCGVLNVNAHEVNKIFKTSLRKRVKTFTRKNKFEFYSLQAIGVNLCLWRQFANIFKIYFLFRFQWPPLQLKLCTPTFLFWSTLASTTPANTSMETTESSSELPSTSRRENISASTTVIRCGEQRTDSFILVTITNQF